jgi:hypothetical protein
VASENSVPAESFMPTQDELNFFKAIAPMIVEEMQETQAAGGRAQAWSAEKQKATELVDLFEPATRRPPIGAGPIPPEQH